MIRGAVLVALLAGPAVAQVSHAHSQMQRALLPILMMKSISCLGVIRTHPNCRAQGPETCGNDEDFRSLFAFERGVCGQVQ